MRDYQTKQNKGGLPDTINNERFGAGEFNSIATELEASVTSSGQTLAPSDGTGEITDQLSKAMAIYGAGGAMFHMDSGAADAYVLSPISPKKSPSTYFDGFTVLWVPDNDNTGPSTINVAALGVKDLVAEGGSALIGGEIIAGNNAMARYNMADDRFELLIYSFLRLPQVLTDGALQNIQVNSTETGFELAGPLTGVKNKIINGNFNIWQREVTQTAFGLGSDDRWYNGHNGSTKTHSRVAFTIGAVGNPPGNSKYFSRTVVSSVAGAANYVSKTQHIEGVRTFAGQLITLSFWAKADSSKNIATEFTQDFGTSGSPSAVVSAIGVTTHALTTSWQRFTASVSIPSILGKTLGTDGNDYLQLLFWFDAGSSFNSRTNSLGQQSGTFDIAQVQVERGPVATIFDDRPFGMELRLCQRYFQKSYDLETIPGTITVNGRYYLAWTTTDSLAFSIKTTYIFPTTMRIPPTVTTYSITTGASGKVQLPSGDVTPDLNTPSENNVNIGGTNGAATTSRSIQYHLTADAEL